MPHQLRKICLQFLAMILPALALAQRVVIPGDNPDPSVVKIGDTYWATATTSNWAPIFPLYKSGDLLTWESVGAVFNKAPEWADYYFWAPEISYDNGKIYIYYSAHKKGGGLCLGVASADRPEGPYKDHGTLMCQDAGSIDAYPQRDSSGKLYLIWKEDGNSINQPTPIWAMEMNEARTELMGEKKELFRNDLAWEGNLVEGFSIARHNDYYYAFYSAAGCCGAGCNYVTGVARAKNVLGPWEKMDKPVLTDNAHWKCPGHGTPVEKDGKFYFLYHAYDRNGGVYTGRQALLMQYKPREDGWLEFIHEGFYVHKPKDFYLEDFNAAKLSPAWQWSVFQQPVYTLKAGQLSLAPSTTGAGTVLAQKTLMSEYTATTDIDLSKSNASGGVALIGDEKNMILVKRQRDSVQVIRYKDGNAEMITGKKFGKSRNLVLRIAVTGGNQVRCFYSLDGKEYFELNESPLDSTTLPPWDRAVRVGLVASGKTSSRLVVNSFIINYPTVTKAESPATD